MNTVTPRIFVAATEQNDGKTTTCLGLFAALRKRLGRIGYIKPVGQRFGLCDPDLNTVCDGKANAEC